MRSMAAALILMLFLTPRAGVAQGSVTLPPTTEAPVQAVATLFEQLQDSKRLLPGYSVFVTDRAGRRTKATIVDLTGTTLTVRQGRSTQTVAEAEVHRIELRDSIEGGILLGLGAGLATAVAWCRLEESQQDDFCYRAAYFSLPTIGAGVWIGGAIDAAVRKTLFLAPGRNPSTRLTIAPTLSAHTLGAQMSLGW